MALDATKPAEHELIIQYNGDFNFKALIQALWWLGQAGASREIEIASDDKDIQKQLKEKGYGPRFGWEGDGADKIINATIDGEKFIER